MTIQSREKKRKRGRGKQIIRLVIEGDLLLHTLLPWALIPPGITGKTATVSITGKKFILHISFLLHTCLPAVVSSHRKIDSHHTQNSEGSKLKRQIRRRIFFIKCSKRGAEILSDFPLSVWGNRAQASVSLFLIRKAKICIHFINAEA